MSAGLQITNDHGVVQIDADYKNLCFIRKYSVVTSSITSNSGIRAEGSFAAPSISNRILALRTSEPAAVSQSGDTYTIKTRNPTTVDAYLFANTPTTAGSSGAGILVCNGAGEIVFSSDQKYMRVAAAVQVPNGAVPDDSSGFGNFVYSSLGNGTYAVALSHQRQAVWNQGGEGGVSWRIWRDYISTGENGVAVSNLLDQVLPAGASLIENPQPVTQGGVLLIFDVSNY